MLTVYLKKAGINAFFIGLLLMVLLAWLFPEYGTSESPLPLRIIIKYGVVLIFFFYGLGLNIEKLKAGLKNLKLHLVIQSVTFILFPVIALAGYKLSGASVQSELWIGILYLAALPSTVSSSVVMVSIAGGNLSAAIFNASISSIIGIFVTPLWVSIFIGQATDMVNPLEVVVTLCLQILLPVLPGVMLHKKFGQVVQKNKNRLRYFDQSVILLIVYTAFCESFSGNAFYGNSLAEILFLSVGMLLFFFSMFFLIYLACIVFKFDREDRIAALFCGSKKSLVQGAVMGSVLFLNTEALGIILLPLMLYHILQLIAGSIIAERMAAYSGG